MVVIGVLATSLVLAGSSTMGKDFLTTDGASLIRWAGVSLMFLMIPYHLWLRRADTQLGEEDS